MARDRHPHFSGKLRACVAFARFAADNGLDPFDAAHLCHLARKAFTAGERNCNLGTDASDAAEQRAGNAFEEKAKAHGFKVQWPGLWPMLLKDGRSVYLPEGI